MSVPSVPVIWQPDTRHRTRSGKIEPREFEWLCSLLSEIEVTHLFDGAFEKLAPNPLVVLEGFEYDPAVVTAYLRRLKDAGSRVGLIHVGDESNTASLRPYTEADFVFRNYWNRSAAQYSNCHYLPLGHNCPVELLPNGPLQTRPHLWSFAGQRKDSRRVLLEVLEGLSSGHLVVNEKFNSGLAKEDYGQLLGDSKIVLCPRGWISVESYRFYEALEAGAIPLVEDDSGWGLIREHVRPSALANAVLGGPRYWADLARRSRPPKSYWLDVYGSSFPCPRIYRWENLPAVLEQIDVERLGPAIQSWWRNYKRNLRDDLAARLQTDPLPTDSRAMLEDAPASTAVPSPTYTQ